MWSETGMRALLQAISTAQTDGSQRVEILTDGSEVSVQNPFPTDGDSVYAKDVDVANSSIGGFSGAITDLFDSRTSTIVNSSGDNPKSITIALKRPIQNHSVTLVTASGTFSNTKLIFKNAAGTVMETIDESGSSTGYTSRKFDLVDIDTYCVLTIEFHTANTITLGFLLLRKTIEVDAHLVALKPDNTATHINATAGGNLKMSLEEIEAGVAFPSLPQKVAEGAISGAWGVNKFGAAPDGIQTSATDIWDRADATPTQQIWLAPTAARIHTIVSTNDNDGKTGSPSSTGARTLRVYGLTAWDAASETSEDITLDGTTGILTANAYVIIHRMKVLTSGTGGPNIGTITATAASDGTVTAAILPGNGQTEMAIYGIPSTKTAYVLRWGAQIDKTAAGTVSADFRLLVNETPTTNTVVFLRKDDISLQSTGTSQHDRIYAMPYKISGPAIIKIQAIGSANDIDGESGFDLIVK